MRAKFDGMERRLLAEQCFERLPETEGLSIGIRIFRIDSDKVLNRKTEHPVGGNSERAD
jgi:hypothetical protein